MTTSWTSAAFQELTANWPVLVNAAVIPAAACGGALVIVQAIRTRNGAASCGSEPAASAGLVDVLALLGLLLWMTLRLRVIPDIQTWTFPPKHSMVALAMTLAAGGLAAVVIGTVETQRDSAAAWARRCAMVLAWIALAFLAQPRDWTVTEQWIGRVSCVAAGALLWVVVQRAHKAEPGMTLLAVALSWLALGAWADFAGPSPSMSMIALGCAIMMLIITPFGRCGGRWSLSTGSVLLMTTALVGCGWTIWFGTRPSHDLPWIALLPLLAIPMVLRLMQVGPRVFASKSRRGVLMRCAVIVLIAIVAVLWPAIHRSQG